MSLTRRLLGRAAAVAALGATVLALPALANAAPTPVKAFYMYGTTLSGLQTNAYNNGYYFAQHHPGGNRLLMLDFGGARNYSPGVWGAQDFSNTIFSNSQILSALESAANGHHNGWTGTGSTIIAYGNNNSYMTSHGMSSSDAYNAGYYQSQRAQDLASYQSSHGYNKQSAAIGSDEEPGFDAPGISRQLIDGASAQGYALDYDYGSADGCPSSGSGGSCNNGWTVADVAHVSFYGSAVPLPEIYYTVNSDQWTVVRRNWGSGYLFWGSTGSTGVGLTPQQGWDALNARNSGLVLSELICFGC